MKKLLSSLAVALLMVVLPANARASDPERVVTIDQERLSMLPSADQERVVCIAERIEAISAMDRSSLSRDERRALRTEMKGLRHEAAMYNRSGTVLYISTAGIIIILLIILILA